MVLSANHCSGGERLRKRTQLVDAPIGELLAWTLHGASGRTSEVSPAHGGEKVPPPLTFSSDVGFVTSISRCVPKAKDSARYAKKTLQHKKSVNRPVVRSTLWGREKCPILLNEQQYKPTPIWIQCKIHATPLLYTPLPSAHLPLEWCTLWAYAESTKDWHIVTPGASTVVMFKCSTCVLEISHVSECTLNLTLVNALNMSCGLRPAH